MSNVVRPLLGAIAGCVRARPLTLIHGSAALSCATSAFVLPHLMDDGAEPADNPAPEAAYDRTSILWLCLTAVVAVALYALNQWARRREERIVQASHTALRMASRMAAQRDARRVVSLSAAEPEREEGARRRTEEVRRPTPRLDASVTSEARARAVERAQESLHAASAAREARAERGRAELLACRSRDVHLAARLSEPQRPAVAPRDAFQTERAVQDAELAESLAADARREAAAQEAADALARAQARLDALRLRWQTCEPSGDDLSALAVALRYPNGARVCMRMAASTTVDALHDAAEALGPPQADLGAHALAYGPAMRLSLAATVPAVLLPPRGDPASALSLQDNGVSSGACLIVTIGS